MSANQRILGFRPPPDSPELAPSVIFGNLRPAPESLEIFPAHVAKDAADLRHWLADIQRRVLWGMKAGHQFAGVVNCMSRPIPAGGLRKDGTAYETGAPGKVQLHQYADKYGFAWVQHCGNPLLCFTCAPVIRYKRRQELRAATTWAVKQQHLAPIMITFTAPHYADTDPRRQVDAFNSAKRRFKSGRWWQEQKARIGYKHSIRALEVTLTHPRYGIGNGAHVHDHGIYYCEHELFTQCDVDRILIDWLPRWRDCLLAEGVEIRDMDAFFAYGMKISLPRIRIRRVVVQGKMQEIAEVDDSDMDKMVDYVADDMAVGIISPDVWGAQKQQETKKIVANVDAVANQIAFEISPGIWAKTGRGTREKDKHIDHFEYFALALTKYKQCRPYMLKLMIALKGRAWMQWTRGLKSAVGIEEKSDEDLMRENGGAILREYDTKDEWHPINNRKLQRRYIRAMVDDGGEPAETAERMMRIIKAGYDPLTGEAFDDVASG